jgi:hypothetical protein
MTDSVVDRVEQFGLLVLILGMICGAPANADDGGISFGGSPHLLSTHSSVSMQSEVVQMDIHKDLINVDCKFVFHNSGPASTVRMGFPDQGLGAEEPYEGEPVPTGPNLKATFLSYESYVDGKKVPTKLVPTNDRSLYWHTKVVTFKANSDCIIRDVYTLHPGQQLTSENAAYKQTSYTLHTGASWHGPIGKADIDIHFAPDVVPKGIHLKAFKSLSDKQLQHLKWSQLPEGTVIYDGLNEPKLKGETISFAGTNLEPTTKDDIHLYYGFYKLTNMK